VGAYSSSGVGEAITQGRASTDQGHNWGACGITAVLIAFVGWLAPFGQ